MSMLEAIIVGATDDAVSTSNLLRKLTVVAHRLQSVELQKWVASEMNGYATIEDLPPYRGPRPCRVRVTFRASFGGQEIKYLHENDVPDIGNFREAHFYTHLTEPLAELENFASADRDPTQAWPNTSVAQFNKWGEDRKAVSLPMFQAADVEKIITRSMLHGVVETVRNKALDFALNLQSAYPDAGEVGGPTTRDESVKMTVNYNISQTINGGTNTLGNGENVTQNVQINQNDMQGLLALLQGLGISADDQDQLKTAIEQDGGKPGNAVQAYLDKIRNGTIKVAGAVATPVVVSTIKGALSMFFGIEIP
jgi:hypothetical protein